jgi:hypothetical protein
MSQVSFDKHPPAKRAGRKSKGEQLAIDDKFKVGDFVHSPFTKCFGTVDAIANNGTQLRVMYRDEVDGKVSFGTEIVDRDSVEPSAPTIMLQHIRSLADTLNIGIGELETMHHHSAHGREMMSFTALAELLARVKNRIANSGAAKDADYESTWDTIEETAKQEDAEDDFDVFSQFDEPGEEPEVAEVIPERKPSDGPAFPHTRKLIESESFSEYEQDTLFMRLDRADDHLIAGLYSRPHANVKALERVVSLYDRERNGTMTPDDLGIVEEFDEVPAGDPKSNGTVAEPKDIQPAAEATAEDVPTAEASAAVNTATPATTETVTMPLTVLTDAGLIDPSTGEMLDPSLIYRKFGWTEFPTIPPRPDDPEELAEDATKEQKAAYDKSVEALDEYYAAVRSFEAKLDQVIDKALGHKERTARYRAACEKRCEPYDKAGKFWDEQFVQPMARLLAPHKLPKDKNGDYSKKTLVLPSGAVKFTTTGGGWIVTDKEAVLADIKKKGIKKFAAIGAVQELKYDHNKLVAALKSGTVKDVAGTQKSEPDPFGSAKLITPSAKGGNTEDAQDDNN